MFVYEIIRITFQTTKISKMKTTTKGIRIIAGVALLTGIAVTAIAWQDPSAMKKGKAQSEKIDTIPSKNIEIDIQLKDLDAAMKDLDIQLDKVGDEIKAVDWWKINKEINESLKEIDFKKIEVDVTKALKDIDWEKISKDVKESIASVNWDEISSDIRKAITEAQKEINVEEIKKSLEEVKNINMDEIKKELEKVKVELEKTKVNIDVDVKKELDKAKEEIKKAKIEIADTKAMIDEMDKDGLIDKKSDFTIEVKDKTLYINGKKQSDDVKAKYSKYFKSGDFRISIKP